MNIFPKLRKFTPVEKKFPLVCASKNGTTYSKGGQAARVIEISGKDYNGLDYDEVESLYQGRKMFFDTLPTTITVMHQSHRQILNRDIQSEAFSIATAGEIAERWGKAFSASYRTKHFLIFVTASDNISDQLMLMMQKNKDETLTRELERVLDDVVENSLIQFQNYGARELKGDDLASYWAWMLNGEHGYQKMPKDGFFDDLLTSTTLSWSEGKKYQVYDGPVRKKYSAWLVIKTPATATSHGLLENLFAIKQEFSVYQTFSRLDKDEAMKEIDDKEKNRQSFISSSEIIALELNEIDNRVQADEISLIRHRFAVEVFADTKNELEASVREIINTIKRWGYQVAREKMNQEALFWSKFPEMQNFNSRQKNMTSENAGHFATFASVGEGLESCTWGQFPVTLFKTTTGSEYSYIFHESASKLAPGNTMIIGGTGQGKTTLTGFMLSQCLKYPDFKILAFDRYYGLDVFTKFHDGSYLDMVERLDINPLHLEDTPQNRAFLSEWFSMLTGMKSNQDKELISSAISQAYDLPKAERNLSNIADAFGLIEDGGIREALNRWLPDGESTHSVFFNGKTDALDFRCPVVGFDMTTLLDMPDALGPMAYYLFHKLFLSINEGSGFAVFVDELPKYLNSPVFRPKVAVLLEEVRKLEGVFIGASQTASALLEEKELSDKFKNNISTWILLPEPRADRAHYVDVLRLNEKEFEWIKQDHPRQAMIKRKNGESAIVNIDLSSLGPYLKCFEGGPKFSAHIKDLKRDHGANWKEKYLAA